MIKVLKRFALLLGIGTVILSGYFSWDGLDQTITGSNVGYTELTSLIGVVMVAVITLLQFVFNTDYASLSPTLKVLGFLSYGYSIYTNKLGLTHLFGFDEIVAWMIAVFMDVVPEALIAWSLDESLSGDLLGNLGKWITGDDSRPSRVQMPPKDAPGNKSKPDFSFKPSSNKPKNRQDFQKMYRSIADKPNGDTQPKTYKGE